MNNLGFADMFASFTNVAGNVAGKGIGYCENEFKEARTSLEKMKGARNYAIIALVATIAIAIFGMILSSVILATLGFILVGGASIGVSDCNNLCKNVDGALEFIDANPLVSYGFLVQAKKDPVVARKFVSILTENTLILKHLVKTMV